MRYLKLFENYDEKLYSQLWDITEFRSFRDSKEGDRSTNTKELIIDLVQFYMGDYIWHSTSLWCGYSFSTDDLIIKSMTNTYIHELEVLFLSDDWFAVEAVFTNKNSDHKWQKYYKCDTMDGLEEFLSDLLKGEVN